MTFNDFLQLMFNHKAKVTLAHLPHENKILMNIVAYGKIKQVMITHQFTFAEPHIQKSEIEAFFKELKPITDYTDENNLLP